MPPFVPAPKVDFNALMRGVGGFAKRRLADMRAPSPLPAALMNPNPTPEQRQVLVDQMVAIAGSIGGGGRARGSIKKAAGKGAGVLRFPVERIDGGAMADDIPATTPDYFREYGEWRTRLQSERQAAANAWKARPQNQAREAQLRREYDALIKSGTYSEEQRLALLEKMDRATRAKPSAHADDDIATFDEWLSDELGSIEAARVLGRSPVDRAENWLADLKLDD